VATPERGPGLRDRFPRRLDWLIPLVFITANAIAFVIVSPNVNDLWAARARAEAAQHGVGLTYWFSWFGGGATPGNYSIVTPYLSALLSAELVGAVSAVGAVVACWFLVRGTARPLAATMIAAVAAALNLWSGRIPFLLASAVAVTAMIAVRYRRRWTSVGLIVVSVAASAVPAAFVALGLAGVFLTRISYRRVCAVGICAVGASFLAQLLIFGTPGPEPYSFWLFLETVAMLALVAFTQVPDYLAATIWLSALAAVVIEIIPNGLGSNFIRMIWFWLPVAVVATSKIRRSWIPLLIVAPLVLAGSTGTIQDLHNSSQPIASQQYYTSLSAELDKLPRVNDFRLEVVSHGQHAADTELLNHAMLARGWETQEDLALNPVLADPKLDAVSYKIWLDNNAVGYVALPRTAVPGYPEYHLVAHGQVPYLSQIWQSKDWRLYRVADPTPIVGSPASLTAHTQSSMTVHVPCACAVAVRVRYSKYLAAVRTTTQTPATIADDGSGWTTMTTTKAGDYVLSGSFAGGLLH
jgi:hypothetical protein